MVGTVDQAPDRALPPVTASSLQVSTRRTAHAVARHASETAHPRSKAQTAPLVQRVETTLGALAAQLNEALDEGQSFDPAAYLRRTGQRATRRTGAGLAGAAIKRLVGKR